MEFLGPTRLAWDNRTTRSCGPLETPIFFCAGSVAWLVLWCFVIRARRFVRVFFFGAAFPALM